MSIILCLYFFFNLIQTSLDCWKQHKATLKNLLKGVSTVVSVNVRDNNVEKALRILKKKMQREGIFREMKNRRHYEKPSEKRVREENEAVRRARKMERKNRSDD